MWTNENKSRIQLFLCGGTGQSEYHNFPGFPPFICPFLSHSHRPYQAPSPNPDLKNPSSPKTKQTLNFRCVFYNFDCQLILIPNFVNNFFLFFFLCGRSLSLFYWTGSFPTVFIIFLLGYWTRWWDDDSSSRWMRTRKWEIKRSLFLVHARYYVNSIVPISPIDGLIVPIIENDLLGCFFLK